ncbi:MAG: PAS domain S-box protein [Gemmatimonadaceae bacterium]
MSLLTTRKVAVTLGGLFLLLLLIGLAAVFSARSAVQGMRHVARGQEIRAEVAALLAGVSQAEVGVRAGFATGDTTYLSHLDLGLARADTALARAIVLTAGELTQQRRLDSVAVLLAHRRLALEAAARLIRTGRAAEPEYGRQIALGNVLMAQVASTLDSVDAVERRLLADRELIQLRKERRILVLIVALALLAGALGVLARRYLLGRRRAEEALRASEERFHAIFDQTFQLTALLSSDGRVVELNETALVFVDVPRSEVIGRHLADFSWWGTSERDLIREAILGSASGVFVRCEAQIRAPGGRAASLDLSFKPMRDADGRITMLIVEGRDITQRLTAESALRTSEARFAGILSLAAEAIVTVDEEQRILYFNKGAEEIFGYSAEEMMGQPLDRLLPPRLRSLHRRALSLFGASGGPPRAMGRDREIVGRHRDGHEFAIEGSISAMDSQGERLFTVVVRDVTERRQAERRRAFLADAGEKLAATLEYEPTLQHVARLAVPILGELCVMDVDFAVSADGSRVTVAHVDPELEQVMRTLRQRYPPSWDGSHPVAVARRTATPVLISDWRDPLLDVTAVNDEHRALFSRLTVRSALFVPLTVRGRVLGVLSAYSSSRSLTTDDLALAQELARRAAMAIDNAQAYRAARRAATARDEVLGVVSHDLRNPLSAIIMCGEALLTEDDPVEITRVGDVIRSSARWMQHIIRDLLDVTAIEAGRLGMTIEQTTVSAVVEALAVMHAAAAREREVTLHTEIADGLTVMLADPDRIIQAVGNLLANAIRFTPVGGDVRLSVTRHETSGVAFRVSDTGPGIALASVPHIFDRFWQGPEGRRGGFGLGLPIAKGIAEAHGGWVDVISVPGSGCTFTVVLPGALAGEQPDGKPASSDA